VAGYRQQLQAHLTGRKNSAYIGTDFAPAEADMAGLSENSDDITAAETEAMHFALEQWLKQHPGKELDYLGILAGELHASVLEREGKHGVMYKRVAELEAQIAELKSAPTGATVPVEAFAALEAKVNALLQMSTNG
jgi:hypothetical protein